MSVAPTATGERYADAGRDITLCYETLGDPSDPPLLLVMGLGMQLVAWPDDLCERLVERGFHVIRFDNRDAGRSTHIDGPPPKVGELLRRKFPDQKYTLADMAQDTANLLRELDLAPAHIVGASMGGMIGQTLAANHPDSVRSLVSIMSSTGSRWKGQPALAAYRFFLKGAPAEREAYADHVVKLMKVVGARGLPQDLDRVHETALRSWDRDHDPAATGRQLAGVLKSGDRTPDLARITAPTLVIHGSDDRLIRISGGRATARAIRNANFQVVEGMGHDLPSAAWPPIVEGIVSNARRAS